MNFQYKKYIYIPALTALLSFFANNAASQGLNDFDISDLPRLRTMATTQQPGVQSGMEVGNVDVPSILQGRRDAKELPEEGPGQPLLPILFDCNMVDPDSYVIGPDDQILMYFFGVLDKEYRLTVTPEGSVNIPTVGSVKVGDRTLTEAKNIISREVGNKYKGIPISVTLARPRYFRVFVSGMVRSPGAVETHALQRVSDVIDKAGLSVLERAQMVSSMTPGSSQQQQQQQNVPAQVRQNPLDVELEAYLKRESSQRTIVIHRGEKSIPVDLQRFRRFGDLESNPYVNAGDRIEVPPYVGNMFIYGQINEPGRFEFRQGDRILDLVQFAGGVTSLADTTRATLTRFDPEGEELSTHDINLYDALFVNPDAPQYRLQESDRLNIWRKYDYKIVANVSLRGEVRYPGIYPITPNVTTLSDLVDMAGGLTGNANLEEAKFTRPSSSTQDLEYDRLSKMLVADMSEEEYDLFKNLSRSRRGEISVDFVSLFRQNDLTNDIRLQNGDQIEIPVVRSFVNVIGAVQQPGFMRVEAGKDVNYYINRAGGFNFNAHKSKMRVIKAQTGQRLRPSNRVDIEGGDTIHVPEKQAINTWELMKDGAMVFANVATVILLARQLTQ